MCSLFDWTDNTTWTLVVRPDGKVYWIMSDYDDKTEPSRIPIAVLMVQAAVKPYMKSNGQLDHDATFRWLVA